MSDNLTSKFTVAIASSVVLGDIWLVSRLVMVEFVVILAITVAFIKATGNAVFASVICLI